MSHLLCEFGARLQDAGLGALSRYGMPMTQEELADALGLTAVQVNRTLMGLKRDGLAQRRAPLIYIDDWNRFAIEGDFTPQYLHLQDELVRPPAAGMSSPDAQTAPFAALSRLTPPFGHYPA